jgi:GntR family transcriptional repressor for pyruvate dehydrogenase complex
VTEPAGAVEQVRGPEEAGEKRLGAPSGRAAAKPTRALRQTLLAPIPMRMAGERIAERIVTAIALGEFAPDQRLPTERELAAMLEVSRTTVREALQRLQASGYVTTRRGRGGGTFVTTGQGPDADEMIRRTLVPAWEELTEILDFRRLIEQLIARTAAQRRDERDVAAIRRAVDDYARAADREASRLADHALHQAIARATHNARLVDLSARIRRDVSLGFDAEPYTAELRDRALRQHPRLADAVIAGNPVLAGDCAASHFSLTENMLTELHARISIRSAGESDARSQSE